MMDVSFEHWRYVIPDEVLSRYGSPHFDKARARRSLCECFQRDVSHPVDSGSLRFDPDQLLCANEVFPEAAIADPLADLDVWDEWCSGVRSFPHPGLYGKLDITTQEKKTNSTSSVGVIGEIMAGLFGQALIAPLVLVRVVRRWPDFIFHVGGKNYAFLEAKAFTVTLTGSGIFARVPEALLGDCLTDAVQQLNADAQVTVWGAFTHIRSVRPLRFAVTFVEFAASGEKRAAQPRWIMPQVVVDGLAERAVKNAAGKLAERDFYALVQRDQRRKELTEQFGNMSQHELEQLLSQAGVETDPVSRQDLSAAIQRQAQAATVVERGEGRRLLQAKAESAQGKLALIRETAGGQLKMRDLTAEEHLEMLRRWFPDWRRANQPFRQSADKKLWQFSGVAFMYE